MKPEFLESENRNQQGTERRRYSRRFTDYSIQNFQSLFLPYETLGRQVLLLNDQQRVIYQSDRIGEWIRQHQLPLRLNPHFCLSAPKQAKQFQAFLKAIKSSRPQHSGQPTESCNLLLPSSAEHDLRLNCFALEPNPINDIKILILLSSPGLISDSQWQAFRNQHQLTGAELRLSAGLAKGLSLDDYSQKHQLSIHTARSQLKSVFAKTETRRQSDLVRLILLATSP